MKTKGVLKVFWKVFLGMMLGVILCQWSFAAPAVKAKPQPQTQPIVKTRVFNSPSVAIMISQAKSLSELKDVTERFIDVIGHYDVVAPETVVPSSRAYVEALRTLESNVRGFGFGALLEDARVRPEMEAKLEPLKQQLLGYFSENLTLYYLTGTDVLLSPTILRDIVATQNLSQENQKMLLDLVVDIHVKSQMNINDFLMENVVKPLLRGNEALRFEYLEALGLDLTEKPLFSEEELFRERSEELARDANSRGVIDREGQEGKIIDLVEAREGVEAGRAGDVTREDPLVRVGRNVRVIGR
ncbi:MAG: hypothetical protein HYY61_02860 [Deltaproteobacteria bacterium]|nr:hypothetical protein [Deltaproteobacteria bacterium]